MTDSEIEFEALIDEAARCLVAGIELPDGLCPFLHV